MYYSRKQKIKHLLVFSTTALLLSLPIFILYETREITRDVSLRETHIEEDTERNRKGMERERVQETIYLKKEERKGGKKVLARITEYGKTGKKTASGKWPELGMVATSDRTIPFGSSVQFDNTEYTVEDRTALWVHEKFGFTIDVYSENPEGRDFKEVVIYEKEKTK